MRHLLALTAVATLALGCVEEDPGQTEDFATGLSKTLTLRFESKEGALSLKSSGKKLDCADRFDGVDGERVTCERDGEQVEVIVKTADEPVVVVRDLGQKRGFYTCTKKGAVEGLPSEMKCTLTTIKPRGTGGLSSPFDSSVEGITIPNTHWVDADETILRGMEPRTPAQFDELRAEGIAKVVIFKNATGNDDVGKEVAAWALPKADVLHVPFQWKDLDGFKKPCEQTLDALRFIKASRVKNKRVFFHCTVGEDRTGYLAALYNVVFEKADARAAFDADMCEHGYGAGNPQKPGFVLGKLEDGLTPLYRKMAFLIDEGALTESLESAACASEPSVPDDFMPEALSCGTSTTLVP